MKVGDLVKAKGNPRNTLFGVVFTVYEGRIDTIYTTQNNITMAKVNRNIMLPSDLSDWFVAKIEDLELMDKTDEV